MAGRSDSRSRFASRSNKAASDSPRACEVHKRLRGDERFARRSTSCRLAPVLSTRVSWTFVVLMLCAACRQMANDPPAARPSIDLPSDTEIVPGLIERGENFGSLLRSQGVATDEVEGMLASLEGVFDARRVRNGQSWRLERTDTGHARAFEYEIDGRSLLRIAPAGHDSSEFAAEVIPYDVKTTTTQVAGRLDAATSSLFAAMANAGEQPDLSMALADIFSGEVDFNTELQPGDEFHLLTEKAVRDGRFVGYGPIVAAELVNDGRRLVAFRFQAAGGPPGYYDADGRSLKRFFLRSPLKFDPQVSSGFSRSRLHPVLNIRRAHLGVDYRAPAGAPVVAVSNGTVTFAGWTSGGGRTVRIRHASGYESGYLHLSAYGGGIRAGVHVSQGQIIGRVGSTGVATGPHLHYELRKAGANVNPLAEHRKVPPGDPVPADQMDAFRSERDKAVNRLALDGQT
jgi:murein DD-endopeptidase MepM/ murein hydrolase activator NlpD